MGATARGVIVGMLVGCCLAGCASSPGGAAPPGEGGGATSADSSAGSASSSTAPQAPTSDESIQSVPPLDKTTTEASAATKAEQEAKRPNLRLPRGDGWVDSQDEILPEAYDRIVKEGTEVDGVPATIVVFALNTDFPYDPAKSERDTLYCESPEDPGTKVLEARPVRTKFGKGCSTVVEYTTAEGIRLREGSLTREVRNRLGNTVQLHFTLFSEASVYDAVKPDLGWALLETTVTP